MKRNKLQIIGVKIEHKPDEDPDTSWLGEYSNTPKEHAIDRQERGDMGRNEFRYFNPAMSGEQTGNPESPEQDYQRMESLNAGQWCFIGIIAKAELRNPATSVTQVVRSGGLWGIESDSEKDYLASVEKGQLAELRAELLAFGIGPRGIAHAFKSVQHLS